MMKRSHLTFAECPLHAQGQSKHPVYVFSRNAPKCPARKRRSPNLKIDPGSVK